jgi:hypothetical protein
VKTISESLPSSAFSSSRNNIFELCLFCSSSGTDVVIF